MRWLILSVPINIYIICKSVTSGPHFFITDFKVSKELAFRMEFFITNPK